MNIRSLLALQMAALLILSGCIGRKKCCNSVETHSTIQQELNEFIEMDETEEIIIPEEAAKF